MSTKMSEEEQEMEQCYAAPQQCYRSLVAVKSVKTRDEAQPCVAQRNVFVGHRRGESGLTCHEGYCS